jgi:hypothetical protein
MCLFTPLKRIILVAIVSETEQRRACISSSLPSPVFSAQIMNT